MSDASLFSSSSHPVERQEITDDDFRRVSSVAYREFGIHLTEKKRPLVAARLRKILRKKSFLSFSGYLDALETDTAGELLGEFINEISTNHTFFCREKEHFTFFHDTVLPQIHATVQASDSREIRFWCAAAATGEEPYTIAMTLHDYFGSEFGLWDIRMLASDISRKALAVALEGVYPAARLSMIPEAWRRDYLTATSEGDWEVKPEIRKGITWRILNLMRPQFPFHKRFHSIFCRNVMIYFDLPTRMAVINKLAQCTEPGGYLFIGHAETLPREIETFSFVCPAVYQRV